MALITRYRPTWGLSPWKPFEAMERLLEEPFWRSPALWKATTTDGGWTPAMDIFEKDDSFVARVELPGVKEEDIDVSVIGDVLTIKGERKAPEDIPAEQYQCAEMCYGTFARSVALPSAVDPDKIEATYHEGILEIRLEKAAEAKQKKIEVKAG